MKNTLLLLLLTLLSIWFSYANNDYNPTALNRLYDIWATKYDNAEQFQPDEYLTREQVAKFVSVIGITQYHYVENGSLSCVFSDINTADPTLRDHIISACKLWILKGWNWIFNPKGNLTNGEAITIIMRFYTWSLPEPAGKFYENYLITAYQTNFLWWNSINRQNINFLIDRWTFAFRLYKITLRSKTMTSYPENDRQGRFVDGVRQDGTGKEGTPKESCDYYVNVWACALWYDTCPDYCK